MRISVKTKQVLMFYRFHGVQYTPVLNQTRHVRQIENRTKAKTGFQDMNPAKTNVSSI